MKRILASLGIATAMLTVGTAHVHAAPVTCKQILAKYPTGVAKNKASASRAVALGFARPAIDAKAHASARRFDTFRDGTACVTEANKRAALPGLAAAASTSTTDALVSGHPLVTTALTSALANAGATCMVAMRDGKIIGEWYWAGRTPTTRTIGYSTTKPLVGAVVGAAVQLGRLTLDQPVADFVPEWKGTPKGAITIRHFLTHRSGLKSTNVDLQTAFFTSSGASTRTALSLPLVSTPGSTWDYDSSSVSMQVLVRVIERAVGEKFATFAEKYVLRPAGMTNTSFKGDDPAAGWDAGDPWMAGGANTTCRDLARLGQMYHQKGQWAGQQVFSSAYATEASSVQVTDATTQVAGTYGLLLNQNWGGIGHGGACGQMLLTMPSGVTIASMSTSTRPDDSVRNPALCALPRLAALTQATLAVARLSL
ncbi:MAG: serine hydrolase domain-containing protein [Ilumatobacteraceae bacterium]